MSEVVLVDNEDSTIGTCEKLAAHEFGYLHRAFSVYVFNDKNKLLLQQRALTKYHSRGLIANTCCSHQHIGENSLDAAHRRLQEEMGFDTGLEKVEEFIYKVAVPPELVEHEYLHVYFGKYTGQKINPDSDEVHSYVWKSVDEIDLMVEDKESNLAPWTKYTWGKIRNRVNNYI